MKRAMNLSKPPGTRRSPDAWRIWFRGRLNRPPSPKQGADSPQLSNDQVAALLVSGGNRTGGGSGAVSTTAAGIPPAVPLECVIETELMATPCLVISGSVPG